MTGPPTEKKTGQIITFYSYKGGTGRSMLLANTAWLLANAGRRVLIVDWDLEAPGLHRYMAPFLTDSQMMGSDGLIDMIVAYGSEAVDPSGTERDPHWIHNCADVLDYTVSVNWKFESGGTLSLLPAGRQGVGYSTRVNTLNWQNFYERLGGFHFFEALKESMRSNFDFVLIDSRTGVSDTAGICTVQFPDILAICFTLNNQSIEGAAAVAQSVLEQKGEKAIKVFPVPTRLDNSESEKLLERWKRAKDRFEKLLPEDRAETYWDDVAVQYVPRFAYEECLAFFANRPDDPATINLLAQARRLTRTLTGIDNEVRAVDEGVRKVVLTLFAGKTSEVSPLEAQQKAAEEEAQAEERRRSEEQAQAALVEEARIRGRNEASEALQGAARRLNLRWLAVAAGLVLAIAGGYRYYSQNARNAAVAEIKRGDQASLAYEWDTALTAYDTALQTLTADPDLYAKRAEVLVAMERPADAVKDLDEALKLAPESFDLLLKRGEARVRAKDVKGAIEDLSKSATLNPKDAEPLRLLGAAYEQDSGFDKAVGVYTELLNRFPGSEDENTLLRRADLHLKLKNRDEAIKDFTRVADSTANMNAAAFAKAELVNLGVKPIPRPATDVTATVYIQFSDGPGKTLIEELHAALKTGGFKSSGGELKPVKEGEVRYHPRDADRAKRVKEIVELTLARQRYLLALELKPLDPKLYPSSAGKIEVWLPELGSYGTPRALPARAK
jgi:MinD-like ATPase involved in chromosome partitioning or flagellar assembly/tetratricopeptide (TPR) repeat protein